MVDGKFSYIETGYNYALQVKNGGLPAGLYVKRACERFLTDIERIKDDNFLYDFDAAKAIAACIFAEQMIHVAGRWRGSKVVLAPWQCFIFINIFGWVKKSDRKRRFREAFIVIPRKNGKSMLGAIIGNYMLAADDEPGAEVYSGATTEKQAMKVFEPAWLMVEDNADFKDFYKLETSGTRKYPKGIYNLSNNSKFFPVVGDPGDGDSPHCGIVDEYHEHRTSNLYDTLSTGMGAREQPLLLVITTAGTDTACPCFEKQKQCEKILTGELINDTIFTIIFSIDKDDDWTDFSNWMKANPNYGVCVFEDFLRKQHADAMQDVSKQNIIRCKHLNQWCNAGVAWVDIVKWNACADSSLKIEDFQGERCYVGIDLASKIDVAAMVVLFTRKINGAEYFYIFPFFYIPESQTRGEDKTHYNAWVADGYIKATPGDMIDIDEIEKDLMQIGRNHRVIEAAHDPWNAAQFVAHMQQIGMNMVEIPQNVKFLSEPTKELEALVVANRLRHDGNPVLSWMAGNVVVNPDKNENVFPYKERAQNKIDGIIAAVLALGRALRNKPAEDMRPPVFI